MNKTVFVGSTCWKVEYADEEQQEGRRGSTFKELRLIKINPSIHPDLQKISLVHELLHACADLVGMENEKMEEEEWVRRIAPMLTTIIKNNPDLLDEE